MTHTNNYKIIDNFLEKDFFQKVKNTISNEDFPWRRRARMTTGKGEESDHGYFTYCFYNYLKDQSDLYENIIIPILNKLEAKAVIQARANMNIKQLFLSDASNYHTDTFTKNKTAILNLTSCDGGTHLMHENNEIFIESVENRMLVFDANILHRSVKHNNCDVRYYINLNYF
jgi:hypothetical protein